MARRMYRRSLAPRESSISQRIWSKSAANAAISASLRCAYCGTSVMAIDGYRDPGKVASVSARMTTRTETRLEYPGIVATSDLFGGYLRARGADLCDFKDARGAHMGR